MLGFTSPSPLIEAFFAVLEQRGCRVENPKPNRESVRQRLEFLDEAEEYRAAGSWARALLDDDPKQSVAIVVSGLEGRAARVGDLIREGFIPGWRVADVPEADSVNVSYGRPLSDYPVLSIGLSLLRWMSGDALRAAEISVLLRSDLCGPQRDDSRVRAELKLREMPDRNWTLALFAKAFEQPEREDSLASWISRLAGAADLLADGAAPEAIAESIDEALSMVGWPGETTLDSTDFQVLNRWRELLNDFVRLALVQPKFSTVQAIRRIATMAGETLFQPESEAALVNVLGALEASGSEFDHLWVTGLTSRQWPPPSRPLALLSTSLQREYGMPDSTPANTSAYARRSLAALATSAGTITFSFARFDGDAEQAPSPILPHCEFKDAAGRDPGWHAGTWVDSAAVQPVSDDPAPAIVDGEKVFGGAATLDRQAYSPFDAFAFGRLGLRYLPKFSTAIQPVLRGNLVHEALRRLYQSRPDQQALLSMSDDQRSERIAEAVRQALAREFRLADPVLRQVLRFEEDRMETLLARVMQYDLGRDAFSVDSVEQDAKFRFHSLSLTLKADRIDRLDGGGFMILDYKTGAEKKFLTKQEPNSYQLILYGLTFGQDGRDVTALGLYNVDSRVVGINGAGQALDDRDSFGKDLATWSAVALSHLERLIEGDLRVNAFQDQRDSRRTALLSRVAELKRD
jgi:probable DNA repair protein